MPRRQRRWGDGSQHRNAQAPAEAGTEFSNPGPCNARGRQFREREAIFVRSCPLDDRSALRPTGFPSYFLTREAVLTAALVAAVMFVSAISTACLVAFDRLS